MPWSLPALVGDCPISLEHLPGLEVCPTPAPTRHMMQPQDEQMSTMLVVTGITVFSLALIVLIILIIGVSVDTPP